MATRHRDNPVGQLILTGLYWRTIVLGEWTHRLKAIGII